MKFKSITIRTMQGLGDIVWCLQRLDPYFEEVNIKIMMIADEPLQKRSQPLFKSMLPNLVKSVEMEQCTIEEYNSVYNAYWYVSDILKHYGENEEIAQTKIYSFASNKQLEDGIRIDQLEPNIQITETLPYTIKSSKVPFEKYAAVYVSGTKFLINCWSDEQWAEYVNLIFVKFNINLPIILTGAEFDKNTLESVSDQLNKCGYTTSFYIGGDPQQTLDFLKNAKLFIGYQSGLNILCDQLDVPQIMLYFDFLQKLRVSWPKTKNLKNGSHQFFGFEDTPQLAATKTNRPLLDYR